MTKFTHLHVHSQYSILDGASKIKRMIDKAKEDGMPAIALTDHGNMFGIKEFHAAATSSGIKPILGIEAYVARRSRFDKSERQDRSGYHLIILAKNKEGYHNLMRLASLGYVDGFYYKPRIDRELLEKHHEGLIISTACLGGEVPQHIMNERWAELDETISWYKNLFGEDYYLEIMRHKTNDPVKNADIYDNQELCNKKILELSQKHEVKVIATNDSHFLNEEDADAHDLLICLNTGKDLDDPTRMRYTKQEFLKTTAQMSELFADIPEAIANTQEIADKVENYKLNVPPLMPDFPLPDGFDDADVFLRHLAYEGAYERWGKDLPNDIIERLDFELETIKKMGFPGYFLITWDFIKAAREMNVIVGPGRGSAAGSAVAYCIKITNIDPIKYDLLFERFLNPDRISMPDVDIDFDDDGRQQVLDWVTEKYGHEKVSHIVTFGTMAAKSSIKDVARVLKLPLSEANRLAKLVPDGPKVSLAKAFKEEPELERERTSDDQLISQTLGFAEHLEGSVRQTGVHACGILIGRDKLTEHIPIMKVKGVNLLITQYDGRFVEDVGMLKMDFLGLKTLSIIKDTLANVKLSKGIDIDIDTIPIDDEKTFELFSHGETTGIFQFESPGMKKHLKGLKPNRFEDLVAMNALYRPGPMQYIPNFVNRKHGVEEIVYDHPIMEKYLKDTYGITVYQEQVMLQSRALGGFTRGMSDSLRKAMGKKKIAEMDKLKVKFIEGCLANEEFMEGFEKEVKGKGKTFKMKVADDKEVTRKIEKAEDLIDKIWLDWEAFAQYAFNKSHSVCYAYIAYQTGYLKAHHPAEFMAAVLSRNLSDIEKVTIFMDECKRMRLPVLGPDVNESYLRFTVNKEGAVRFGMAAVKGVGEAAVEDIIRERKNGEFKDIFDFVERVSLRTVNKRTLENLAMSGGFDSFELNRSQYFACDEFETPFIELLSKYGNKLQSEKAMAQQTLFGGVEDYVVTPPKVPSSGEWNKLERLNKEKALIGIYLSAHPLDDYRLEIDSFCNASLSELSTDMLQFKDKDINIAGMVTAIRRGITRTGNPFAIVNIEDFTDSYELPFFGKDFVEFNNYFVEGLSVYINGRVQQRSWPKDSAELEYKIKSIGLLSDVLEQKVKRITLTIPVMSLTQEIVNEMENCLTHEDNKGNLLLNFVIVDEGKMKLKMFSRSCKVKLSTDLIEYFKNNSEIEFKIN
ncbi:DNA polymerase III subunit alpha [Ancylomarina euxinus]|uniref:DNA polymerase III subunit alpha n=1 Tax=Ancylomarina euxinus TaxID=2283627 RepID=A0A425Y7M2_9BACT|nr:DNA polymerase III subunit alpha [Ancylomarina euxinus]MCZ4693611.1 DNA polymerase III subunit alpha [Ancylomarina euxinus]MUP13839.1 DNA polymerase III subunit alpha [Ancylomarina euxinus]RRG24529.1 DNA polymerase III subunit alpha [Ancylomarina euxinus]